MIAFVLDRLGLILRSWSAERSPSSGATRRSGPGGSSSRGTSRPTIERLRPRIAVVTNVDLDHHSSSHHASSSRSSSRAGSPTCRRSFGPVSSSPLISSSRCRGSTTRTRKRSALAALELAGVSPEEAGPTSWSSRGGASARARARPAWRRGARRLRPSPGGGRGDDLGGPRRRARARSLPAAPVLANAPSRA